MAVMASVALQTAAPMVPSVAYGVTGSLKDGLQFLDMLNFIYVSSHCMAEKNLYNDKAMHFIRGKVDAPFPIIIPFLQHRLLYFQNIECCISEQVDSSMRLSDWP